MQKNYCVMNIIIIIVISKVLNTSSTFVVKKNSGLTPNTKGQVFTILIISNFTLK